MTVRGEMHICYETVKGPRTIVLSGLSQEAALELQVLLIDSPRVIAIKGRVPNSNVAFAPLAHPENVDNVRNDMAAAKIAAE